MNLDKISHYFIIFASLVVIIAGISASNKYINLILLSIFITMIFYPFLKFLIKKGFNENLSLGIVILSIFFIITTMSMFLGSTINSIKNDLPAYEKALKQKSVFVLQEFKKHDININEIEFNQIFNSKTIISNFSKFLKSLSGLFQICLLYYYLLHLC